MGTLFQLSCSQNSTWMCHICDMSALSWLFSQYWAAWLLVLKACPHLHHFSQG